MQWGPHESYGIVSLCFHLSLITWTILHFTTMTNDGGWYTLRSQQKLSKNCFFWGAGCTMLFDIQVVCKDRSVGRPWDRGFTCLHFGPTVRRPAKAHEPRDALYANFHGYIRNTCLKGAQGINSYQWWNMAISRCKPYMSHAMCHPLSSTALRHVHLPEHFHRFCRGAAGGATHRPSVAIWGGRPWLTMHQLWRGIVPGDMWKNRG